MTDHLPTVNINGTSQNQLVDGLADARTCVEAALASLRATEPNGRDFVGPDREARFERARAVHRRRLAALEDLSRELLADAEAIAA